MLRTPAIPAALALEGPALAAGSERTPIAPSAIRTSAHFDRANRSLTSSREPEAT